MNRPSSSRSTTSPVDERLRDAVRQRCRGWLREHADDISQATQLRLLARVRARPQAATAAYVHRIARNAVMDVVRRHGRREALWRIHEAAATPSSVPRDPERMLLDHELAAVIHEQLERLPPGRREAVVLYLEGHGITEIGERLGRPRKQVDNHVYRGLAALRRSLTARGLAPARAI